MKNWKPKIPANCVETISKGKYITTGSPSQVQHLNQLFNCHLAEEKVTFGISSGFPGG